MATGYVANWGNDDNDGLSWETAKRTLNAGLGFSPIYASGHFEESISAEREIIGSPYVTLNGYNHSMSIGLYNGRVKYLKSIPRFSDVYNVDLFECGMVTVQSSMVRYSTFTSCTGILPVSGNVRYNTLFNTSVFYRSGVVISNNILSNCETINHSGFSYTCFNNCKFKFTSGGLGNDETSYEYPTGTTDSDKLENLKSRIATVYGGMSSQYLIGCTYYSGSYDDIFVDADNGNFHLVNDPSNPALHLGYSGQYVGARPPIATTLQVSTSTYTNLDSSGSVIDQSLDANADWSNFIFDIGNVYEILTIDNIAEIAYRNGMSVNTDTFIGSDISAGSSVLTDNTPYQVIDASATNGTITRDDSYVNVHGGFDTFTAIDEGSGVGLGFSSVDGLTVRQVDISSSDEKIQVKSSLTDSSLSSATFVKLKLHTNPPMVNVDVDGNPILGNGDVGYDDETAIIWKARYFTVNMDIKSNQLFART